MLGDVFHGSHMALGQVHHMDIVSHAGAVVGIVVIAVDAELLPAADGYLGDIGHQIVGDTSGVLADQAGLVGADGIEVPQQDHAPLGVSVRDAGEDLLGHVLGPAIGVGTAACPAGLPQGHFVVGGVDRGGGGEDDILHANFLHDLGQYQGGIQVVVVVFPGLCNAFAHGLETCKVDDAGNLVLGKDLLQQSLIPDIALVEFQGLPGELLNPVQAFGIGIAQIVNDHHAIAVFQQLQAGMGADITGTAGHQYVLHVARTSLYFLPSF